MKNAALPELPINMTEYAAREKEKFPEALVPFYPGLIVTNLYPAETTGVLFR